MLMQQLNILFSTFESRFPSNNTNINKNKLQNEKRKHTDDIRNTCIYHMHISPPHSQSRMKQLKRHEHVLDIKKCMRLYVQLYECIG